MVSSGSAINMLMLSAILESDVVLLSYGTKCARFNSQAVTISGCRDYHAAGDSADLEMEFMNPTVEQCNFLRGSLTSRDRITIEVDNVFSCKGYCTSFAYGAGALDGDTSAQVTFSIVDSTTRALPEQEQVQEQQQQQPEEVYDYGALVDSPALLNVIGSNATWTIAENESTSPRCRNCGGNTVNTTRLGMQTEFTCLECSAVIDVRPKKKRKRKTKKKVEPDVHTAPPERMIVLE